MFWSYFFAILLTIASVLLMFIILLQRGRGGGLAGALGGMGGQSAFGTKAGDVFTKITVGMALAWVVLAGVTSMAMFHDSERRSREFGNQSTEIKATADAAVGDDAGGGLDIPPGDGIKLGDNPAPVDNTPAEAEENSPDDSDKSKPADDTGSE